VTPWNRMADEGDSGRRPKLRVVAGGATAARPAAGAERSPDHEAIVAFLAGDDEAFGELVRRHERLVLALVRRYARSPEDARDLVQRTFLRAFEAARRTLRRGHGGVLPFRRWVIRIAVNLSKNHLRDERRWTRAPLAALGPAEATAPDAPDALERAEQAARVRAAVLRLPRRQREVLTLRIDGELPFAEIADALGITENAAKVTFHHATKRLRALVGEEQER
jgi:RNA polymerase sigma-70 factor, ECF subfamily